MLKATGMVRKIDDLGRVVIPKGVLKSHNIKNGDSMEIYVDGRGEIILKKYEPGCAICGNIEGVSVFKDKLVCNDCASEMNGRPVW